MGGLVIISVILILISGVANAVMDTLSFRLHSSVFYKLNKPLFWNPELSWKNKWKNGDREQGEKFKFSSTILVSTTDAWHLFKFIYVNSLMIGFSLLGLVCGLSGVGLLEFLGVSAIMIILQKVIFETFFSKVFRV